MLPLVTYTSVGLVHEMNETSSSNNNSSQSIYLNAENGPRKGQDSESLRKYSSWTFGWSRCLWFWFRINDDAGQIIAICILCMIS